MSPNSTTPTHRTSPPISINEKALNKSISVESNKKTKQNAQLLSTASYHRSMRPGLVPTPVVAWPTGHVSSGQWPYTYMASNAARMQHPVPVYTYQPAHYIHMAAAHQQANSMANVDHQRQSSGSVSSVDVYQNSPLPGEKLSKTNLYIRGLHTSTTDDDLIAMCKQYGTIISTKAILDKDVNNKCKGYGFVDFDNPLSAQRAVSALQQKGIQAQMARQQEQDPTNLYISNLPKHLDEQQLQQLLTQYGTVVSTRVLRDNGSISKGVGFARMETKEVCQIVIDKLNGQFLSGCSDPLLVKFADGGPKKNKSGDKTWTSTEDLNYLPYDVINANTAAAQHLPTSPRPTHYLPNQVVQSSSGIGWVQPQAYNMQHSTMPMNAPVEGQHHIHPAHHVTSHALPQLTNQMAALHMGVQPPAPTQPYIAPVHAVHPSAAAAYPHQAHNWQMNHVQHVEQDGTIVSPDVVPDSTYTQHIHPTHNQAAPVVTAGETYDHVEQTPAVAPVGGVPATHPSRIIYAAHYRK